MHVSRRFFSKFGKARVSSLGKTAKFSVIAAVGTGQMGGVLCKRLAGDGHTVLLAGEPCSLPERQALAAVETKGTLEVVEDITEAVEKADVVLTCLPNSIVVNEVLNEIINSPNGPLSNATLWLDATSGNPAVSKTIGERLLEFEVDFVDCAVSGGPAGAEEGILTSMIGGADDASKRAEPYLNSFSSNVVHVGPTGSGHAVKCVNNAMMATNLWVAAEGVLALKKFGVSPQAALDAINTSSGRSWGSQNRIPGHVLTRKFDYGFHLDLLEKDHRTCLESVVKPTGSCAPILSAMHTNLKIAQSILKNPAADHVEICKILEMWSDAEIKE